MRKKPEYGCDNFAKTKATPQEILHLRLFMKQILFLVGLLCSILAAAQQKKEWLGSRKTETSLFLDPTEIQFSGSITALLDKNSMEQQYLPFGVGGAQSIYSNQLSEERAWEIVG